MSKAFQLLTTLGVLSQALRKADKEQVRILHVPFEVSMCHGNSNLQVLRIDNSGILFRTALLLA